MVRGECPTAVLRRTLWVLALQRVNVRVAQRVGHHLRAVDVSHTNANRERLPRPHLEADLAALRRRHLDGLDLERLLGLPGHGRLALGVGEDNKRR